MRRGGAGSGRWINHVNTEFIFSLTPDGQANLELIKYHTPNENGIQPSLPIP
jgi:hypothetical protein